MKNLTIFPMSSYKGKISGLIIIGVCLLLMLVVKIHGPLPFLSNRIAPDRQFELFFTVTVFGMYMTAFSKEKDDDERIQAIRAKAMQSAFMIMMGSLLSIVLFTLISRVELGMDGYLVCQLCGFVLALYLILFHIGLYFDPAWSYNDDTVVTNFKKNKRFFIIYTAIVIIVFLALFLIHKA